MHLLRLIISLFLTSRVVDALAFGNKGPTSSLASEAVSIYLTKLKPKEGTFVDRSEEELKVCFQELSEIFGQDDAMDMVKRGPKVLASYPSVFKESMEEYSKIFGEEEAKAMVKRNTGLLFVQPVDARDVDDTTMKMSYVIAFFQPLGPYWLYGMLALLATGPFESFTGIPIRSSFLNLFH